MYAHVTVELKYGQTERFAEAMAGVAKIATEAAGWELREALFQIDGRLSTVRHIWKMRDMNHYTEGMGIVLAHPDFQVLAATLVEIIDNEIICFALSAPYAPQH